MSGVQIGLIGYGMVQSMLLTLGGVLLGLLLGFVAGFARVGGSRIVRGIGCCYVELFRGVPVLVLVFWFVYALPGLGFRLNQLFAGILALALHGSGHAAGVISGAIRAVPAGQHDAATALNFGPFQRALRLTVPHALLRMVGPFADNLIEPLKASVVVSVVSISELTFSGQLIWRGNGRTAAIFVGLLLGYVLLAVVFTAAMRVLRRWADDLLVRPSEVGGSRPVEVVS